MAIVDPPSMHTILACILTFIALPVSAENFVTERPISPPLLEKPTVIGIELSPQIQAEGGLRIVTETGFALSFETDVVDRDLMPGATIVDAPKAADTLPPTSVGMVRGPGVFQPVTARTHAFRLSFSEDVTPSELQLDLESGRINAIRVRGGRRDDAMSNMFAGPAHGGNSVQLSGERVRFVDIEIDTEGVLKIDTIRLLDSPRILFFRATPGKTYRLLSGGYDAASVRFRDVPQMSGQHDPARLAQLGSPRAVTVQDDHDGIAQEADNCPDRWNYDQEDRDNDGMGDACDPCPTVTNGEDADGNGLCDALEDPDKDGIATIHDNCPTVSNRLQEDEDADGIGNLCDETDSRFSADKPWLLWAGIIVMIAALMAVAALAMRKNS